MKAFQEHNIQFNTHMDSPIVDITKGLLLALRNHRTGILHMKNGQQSHVRVSD